MGMGMPEHNALRRILVVEESATLRYILGKLIQKQGFELLAIDSFESAINTLQSASQNLHGIIVGWPNYEQIADPELSQVLVLLDREPYSEMPVIFLSNDAELEILNWISTRDKAALVPWENYQESVGSLQTLLDSQPDILDKKCGMQGNAEPINVMFVDDSQSILRYYQRLLSRHGYNVETAMSVAEAYELANNKSFDIAIVDYFMPDENGYVLCQKLRDNPKTENIRTAVITGTYLDAVIRDCLKAGAIECMFKNEAEELFLSRISSMARFIEVQRSIEKQREHLAAILESVGEGVYGVDNDGVITFVNQATLKVLGFEDEQSLTGHAACEMFHDSVAEDEKLLDAYMKGAELRSWETQFKHESGKIIPVECTVYPLQINDKRQGSVVAFRDISNQRMLEERLRWQATHDHLTELYNRRYFEEHLEMELQEVQRTHIPSALIYLDLDRFKYVNDTVGHETGDQLLVDISQALTAKLRINDILSRIGGDEFAVILKNVDAELAVTLADDLRGSLSGLRVNHEEKSYHVHASVGVAVMVPDSMTAGDVLANADIACNIAKKLGRNRTHLYEQSSDERSAMGSELGWSTRIRDALQQDNFELYYQPIMRMQDIDLNNLPAQDGVLWQRYEKQNGSSRHYEVLVRMRSENEDLFLPDTFIPTAERFNLMIDIDMWVLENALKSIQAAGNKGLIKLSINLSGHTIVNDVAQQNIKAMLDKYGISPGLLTFEITETSAIANLELANKFIEDLHNIGCRFSLDDFGSGFCSFSQLKNLPTDCVKIDGQFVKSMARGATDRAIVTAMNDVAHSLGRYTVAEYVESPEVVRLLKICGVDRVQGNYVCKPLPELSDSNVVKLHSQQRGDFHGDLD